MNLPWMEGCRQVLWHVHPLMIMFQNVIKKHENTRAEKEADRIHHVDTCNAQTGPIFLAYRANAYDNDRLYKDQKKESPLYDFISDDGIRHSVFRIDAAESSITKITGCICKEYQEIYIADGHHRAASAVKVGLEAQRTKIHHYTGEEEFNYFLSVLFPDEAANDHGL